MKLIGRKEEQEILRAAIASNEGEMIAVIGRRRVGKTFLIQSVYKKNIVFELTGTQNAPAKEQLKNFARVMTNLVSPGQPLQTPATWQEAFWSLRTFLEKKVNSKKKVVVFFDELPWLATGRSGFLRAFSYFWNSWGVQQNLVFAICGSAASWMIKNVVNDTGGLYNRITKRIYLEPFTLGETEFFFKSRKINFTRYQIVQIFMVTGGIPHYLKEIQSGKSAVQNINRICFSRNGLLTKEFFGLYPALFANPEGHILLIRALAQKHSGLTRQEIIKVTDLKSGERLNTILSELSQSGFITGYRAFGKKKGLIYRLTDEYSLFYLKFIEQADKSGDNTWHLLSQSQAYKTWSGYAFENLCLKHIFQIKKAMSIAGIYSIASSFYRRGTADLPGAQIDLVLDRNDNIVTLFEIKFYKEAYSMTKAYAENIRKKQSVFKASTKTKKQLFWAMIAPFGLQANQHSMDIIGESLSLDDLFD